MALNIDSGEVKLVLLCPAWKMRGTAKTAKPGAVILLSQADDVIPFADTFNFHALSAIDSLLQPSGFVSQGGIRSQGVRDRVQSAAITQRDPPHV